MTWNKYPEPQPKEGDIRITTTFPLIPYCLNNIVKWLCLAKVRQKYVYNSGSGSLCCGGADATNNGYYWEDIEYVD